MTLLPTPSAQRAGYNRGGAAGRVGPIRYGLDHVEQLLPTPTVNDSRGGRNATANRSEGQEHHHVGWTLTDVAYADRWGEYAAAIARWEHVTSRPAPSPTIDNPRAKHGRSLNPALVEWMMGLPAGWVTDVPGLTRTQQLSLLGDGVVPQQGIAAFGELWGRLVSRETSAA